MLKSMKNSPTITDCRFLPQNLRMFTAVSLLLIPAFYGALASAQEDFSLARSGNDIGGTESVLQRVAEADAVIHGVVSNVEYRMSDNSKSSRSLPHAFVTYQIVEVISGLVDPRSLTLRFVGGPDGQGGIVSIGDVPMFNVGDEDVLFIRGNGTSSCPLAGCGKGRFRIFERNIYSEQAVPLVAIDRSFEYRGPVEAALLRRTFPAPAFDELIKNPEVAAMLSGMLASTSLDELRRQYEKEAPKVIEYSTAVADSTAAGDYGSTDDGGSLVQNRNSVQARPLLALELLASLRTAATRHQVAKKSVSVNSLDPNKPFSSTLRATPVLPRPIAESPAEQSRIHSRYDLRERELVESQNHDPVILIP